MEAQFLNNREPEELIEEVMDHFTAAQAALQSAWGQVKWREGSANATLADTSTRLSTYFGSAADILGDGLAETSPAKLPEESREILINELGRLRMTEIQRQLLLSAITEQWVEYLTKVEALRVSIGLEAYAQRDPLVQYRRKASEMFQVLMSDIRSQVVSRVFAYQPRRWNANPLGAVEAASIASNSPQKSKPTKTKKKRKRHKKK